MVLLIEENKTDNAVHPTLPVKAEFTVLLTLFIMWALIIDTHFATAKLKHFEMQIFLQ